MSRVAVYSGAFNHNLHGLGRLGQDVYDPVTGDYVASLPAADNPVYSAPVFGPPAPTPEQIAYDNTVTSGSTPNPAYAYSPTVAPAPVAQPGIVQALTAALAPTVPRPAPVVSVPLSASSIGLWLSSANIIAGFPNVLVLGGLAFGLTMLLNMGGRRRR